MGQSLSQEEIDKLTHLFFTDLPKQYINVGIDDSLLKYSAMGSTDMLNEYSSELLSDLKDQVPSYTEKIGEVLAGFSEVPNAVGIGALVISMILQFAFIATKGSQDNKERPVDMLRRIFAEEKASEVRDLMEEYLKRYKMHLRADHLLVEDTRFLERSLSQQLTRLRNSMLTDGHMTSRAFKHWANGAAFHAQMLIHMARLQKKNPQSFNIAKSAARSAINTYSRDNSELLEKYKEYKTSKFILNIRTFVCLGNGIAPAICNNNKCNFNDVDINQERTVSRTFCDLSPQQYIDYIFSKHTDISQLKSYFVDLQENVSALCNEEGSFQIGT